MNNDIVNGAHAAGNAAQEGANFILGPLQNLWAQVVPYIPDVVLAIIIVLVGLIVAPLFGKLVKRLARLTKIDELSDKSGVHKTLGSEGSGFTFAGLLGAFGKWFVLLIFFIVAANVLHWGFLSNVLNTILFYIPNVIVAILFVAFGLIGGSLAGGFVVKSVETSKVPVSNAKMLGATVKWGIVIFAALAALLQLGIAPELVEILYAGMVLALALAFGLGGREKAAKILDSLDASTGGRGNTKNS